MTTTVIFTASFCTVLLLGVWGCKKTDLFPTGKSWDKEKSWQANAGWKAEDFFADPKVIALCNAIEKKDLAGVEKCLVDGANVNFKGKGNMTPLLWAYFSGEDFFKTMLEHGADPNIIFSEDFGVAQIFIPGSSVVHMTAATKFPNYFALVMEHGGDPNLPHSGMLNVSPIYTAISEGKKENALLLIEKGANIDYRDDIGMSPLMDSVKLNQFEITLFLLEAGADYSAINNYGEVLANHLASKEKTYANAESPAGDAYRKVVAWLKDKGVEIEKWDDKVGAKRKAERAKQKKANQSKE